MSDRDTELVALLSLLRMRPGAASWAAIARDVAECGSATAVLDSELDGALLPPEADRHASEAAVADWRQRGLRWVTILDDDYPARLRDIREAPPLLFVQGQLVASDEGVSVVGSRDATTEALEQAAAIAAFLVADGLSVISGLAAGVDTAAHQAALDQSGRTVAFLGTGITQHYPAANRPLQQEIARDGLLLSQFYPDAPPTRQSFPMRNATMSGYGLATIVVAAGEKSGARIQARVAGEHGRPVILTTRVVERTEWGRRMAGSPNVHVARTLSEVKDAVRRIRDAPVRLRRALELLKA